MKKTLLIGLVVSLVTVATLWLAVSLVDLNRYKGDISAYVSQVIGRTFSIRGALGFRLLPTPELYAEDVRLANVAWGAHPDMLSVGRVELGIALLPLLEGQLSIDRLVLVGPTMILQRDRQGHGNWELPVLETETDSAPGAGTGPPLRIDQLRIEKARIEYHDTRSGTVQALSVDRLTLHDEAPTNMAVALDLRYGGIPLSLSGHTARLNQLLANRPFTIDLSGQAEDIRFSAKGRMTHPLDLQGLALTLQGEAPSIETLARWSGVPLPSTGEVEFRLTLLADSAQDYRVPELALRVDKSDVSGSLALTLAGPRPQLTAELSSRRVDLTPYVSAQAMAPDPPEGRKAAKSKTLISDAPLPLAPLHHLDADLQWNIAALETANASYRDTKLGVQLEDARLEIKPLAARFAKGHTLTAEALIDARRPGATLAMSAEIKGLELGELKPLKETINGGPTRLSLRLKASGDHVKSVIATLDGRLLIQVGEGKVVNRKLELLGSDLLLDLIHAINPWASSTEHSRLDCAVARIDIRKGVGTWDKSVALETERMTLISSGSVDLNTERLDVGIHPEARKGLGLDGREVVGLVRIGGTLAAPRLTASKEGAVRLGATVGAAVATGGVSYLVQKLYSSQTRDPHPCLTALGTGLAGKASRPRSASDQIPRREGEVKKAVGGVGRGLKGVRKGIKDLFRSPGSPSN